MNKVFLIKLLLISQTSWPIMCNPYPANFHKSHVIMPMVMGFWSPVFNFKFLS